MDNQALMRQLYGERDLDQMYIDRGDSVCGLVGGIVSVLSREVNE